MASARKRGKTWMGLYRDADGRQRSSGSHPTERAALKAARLAKAGVMPVKTVEVYQTKVRGKVTVASYAAEWLPAHPLSPHARYVYETVLRTRILPVLGGLALVNVTAQVIRQMFRSMETEGVSRALGLKVKTILSSMMQTAAEDGVIPVNPVRGVKYNAAPAKRRRALTADQWFAVREHLTGEHRLLADVQMATGARIEEIRGMMAEDITDGVWHVQRVRNEVDGVFSTRDQTKTGKDRYIPLEPELAETLKAVGPGRVFTDIKADTYRQCHWYPACKAAGLDWKPAPRDLRRTYATLARSGGADLEDVRVALGHTRIATTDVYLGERPEARDAALKAVQRALRGAA